MTQTNMFGSPRQRLIDAVQEAGRRGIQIAQRVALWGFQHGRDGHVSINRYNKTCAVGALVLVEDVVVANRQVLVSAAEALGVPISWLHDVVDGFDGLPDGQQQAFSNRCVNASSDGYVFGSWLWRTFGVSETPAADSTAAVRPT